uniref:hypothetical protein n=1 Tax=Prevotella sp. TaxID=59823 RepID=UPI0040273FF2
MVFNVDRHLLRGRDNNAYIAFGMTYTYFIFRWLATYRDEWFAGRFVLDNKIVSAYHLP